MPRLLTRDMPPVRIVIARKSRESRDGIEGEIDRVELDVGERMKQCGPALRGAEPSLRDARRVHQERAGGTTGYVPGAEVAREIDQRRVDEGFHRGTFGARLAKCERARGCRAQTRRRAIVRGGSAVHPPWSGTAGCKASRAGDARVYTPNESRSQTALATTPANPRTADGNTGSASIDRFALTASYTSAIPYATRSGCSRCSIWPPSRATRCADSGL